MTLQEILEVTTTEFKALSPERQRGYVQFLSMQANGRMSQLENSGLSILSYAYADAQESGGRFSSKGKDARQLKSEFIRVKKFLNAESSTIRGTVKTSIKPIETATGESLADKERRKMAEDFAKKLKTQMRGTVLKIDNKNAALWKMVDKARELGAESFATSSELIQEAFNAVSNPHFIDVEDAEDYIDRIAQEIAKRAKEAAL